MDRIRVIRMLVYEGPRDAVEYAVEHSVQGIRHFGGISLQGVTLGAYPEIIQPEKEKYNGLHIVA